MDTLRLWATHRLQQLRSSLWVIPAFGVALGLAAALLLAPLGDTGAWLLPLFVGSADSARSVLSVIAGSTMTVTSLTFSLTVVALQVASGQFTPRLMRSFLADRGNKVVLAIFLGTFTLSLVLLQAVQGETDRFALSVPTLGVSVAIIAALASIIALVYFIHHLTQQLRIDRVMARVGDQTVAAIEATFRPARLDDDVDEVELPDDVTVVPAPRTGHLDDFDADAMLDAAADAGLSVRLRPVVGAFVTGDTTLAWAWRPDGGTVDVDEARRVVVEHVVLATDRSLGHDPSFGIRQLVDIGTRALSPGVNDPTTAVQAIQHLTRILRTMAGHDLGTLVRARDDVTVMIPRPNFADHLAMAVNQLLHYGRHDAEVLRALAQLVRDVAEGVTGPTRHEALATQLGRIARTVGDADMDDVERAPVDDAIQVARDVLGGQDAGADPHAS
ncbi:DUF2254 domain-containing protein [Salsipaludibacter albus]|uniref:DUF2254 domain-containing protein n=1 Tax=Salsipaludibacter albus TaxID=2849650 RepID=UPI001EE4CD96|nr:DUF2254 domain-containing protein [Salsipaludibacter albus]MBY5162773.1 DUF2254 domain-containing protein [Salsipaludibacter albus]